MSQEQTPRDIFKQISIVHIAICISTTIIVGLLYTLRNKVGGEVSNDTLVYEFVVPVISCIVIASAFLISKKWLKNIDSSSSLIDKMLLYKKVLVFRWAALEGSAFLGALGFYMTGRMNLFLYAAMMGIMLIYFRPLKSRIQEDLKLSSKECDSLDS